MSTGTDQIMLVYAILTHGGSATAVTYNGSGLTSVGSVSLGNSTTMYVYRMVNPTVTTANVVVTNGGSGNAHIVVSLYTGVNQTTPIGNTATGTTGGTDPMAVSVSHTRSSADSTVLVASASGWNIAPSSNTTNFGTGRHFANTGGEVRSYALSDYSPGSTGTTGFTHTRVSGGWSGGGAYALELMPASAGSSPTFTPSPTSTPVPCHPIISAVSGGFSSGATGDDFIQVYNPCCTTQDLTGYTIRRFGSGVACATTGGVAYTFGSVSLAPGQFFLLGTGVYSSGNWGPSADATWGSEVFANSGLAFINPSSVIVESVGGGTAGCFETTATAAFSNGLVYHRSLSAPWTDTNNNSSDFSTTAASSFTPRNMASAAVTNSSCGTPTFTPVVTPTNTPAITPTNTPVAGSCTITYDSNAASFGSTQVGSGTWTNAWNRGTASNAVMFVVITSAGSWTGTVTYGGSAMTLLTATANSQSTLIYYLANPLSGSNDIVVDAVPDTWTRVALTAFSYSGVDTTDPFLSNNFAAGTGSNGASPYTQSVDITPVRGDSTVLALYSLYNGTASTTHSVAGGTSRYSDSRNLDNPRDFGFGDLPSTGATMSVSQTYTGGANSKNRIAHLIELNPCGPQPTATTTPTISQTFTHTPYYSPTFTATRTATSTHTPFFSPTFTATRTATRTHTRTATRTATPTATRTQTPNWSPTVSPTSAPASPTHTLTPIAIPMNKTVNVGSASIGDTISFCISWQNNTGGSTSVVIWDTLPIALVYVGADNGGTYSPRVVVWDLGSQANGASGTVCVGAVVAGYPWLPGHDTLGWLAQLAREDDINPWPYAHFGGRP